MHTIKKNPKHFFRIPGGLKTMLKTKKVENYVYKMKAIVPDDEYYYYGSKLKYQLPMR